MATNKVSSDNDKNGNRTVVILIVSGLIMLGTAAGIFFKNQNNGAEETPAPQSTKPTAKAEPAFAAPAPIQVTHKPRNLTKDSDTNEVKNSTTGKNRSAARQPIRRRTSQSDTQSSQSFVASGTMDARELAGFINSKFASVRACYERRLKVNAALQGIVDLRIIVLPSGKVAGVYVNSDSVGDAPMLKCVKSTVKKWRFPKPEGGKIIFDKPFKFQKKI